MDFSKQLGSNGLREIFSAGHDGGATLVQHGFDGGAVPGLVGPFSGRAAVAPWFFDCTTPLVRSWARRASGSAFLLQPGRRIATSLDNVIPDNDHSSTAVTAKEAAGAIAGAAGTAKEAAGAAGETAQVAGQAAAAAGQTAGKAAATAGDVAGKAGKAAGTAGQAAASVGQAAGSAVGQKVGQAAADTAQATTENAQKGIEMAKVSVEHTKKAKRAFDKEKRRAKKGAIKKLLNDAYTSAMDIDNAQCFPGDARVYVQGRGIGVPMRDLKLGDRVLSMRPSGDGFCFARFLGFMHAQKNVVTSFISVSVRGREKSAPLRLTRAHLVFSSSDVGVSAKTADSLRPGDEVISVAVDGLLSLAPVTAVAEVFEEQSRCHSAMSSCGDGGGTQPNDIFAPLTETGTLVVDGIICSCYADVLGWGLGFHEVAHRAVVPWRLVASLLATHTSMPSKTDEFSVGFCDGIVSYFNDLMTPLHSLLQAVANGSFVFTPFSSELQLEYKVKGSRLSPSTNESCSLAAGIHPAAAALLAISKLLPLAAWRRLDGAVCAGSRACAHLPSIEALAALFVTT
eukprot:TRINITY_DN50969_c0_g1_i1.p1 TRINITY_DN50969_c0_g1~~TRINITY_DN50969_c0_g1_i1.p1  ORF type:complete len:568 (+),score=84.45 TRINITY_DN50969_c0_g1_i1:76-1779(+)